MREDVWAMVRDIEIRNDSHTGEAGRNCSTGNTPSTSLYPGKIPERLRLVKK